jgi:hypothetical protein
MEASWGSLYWADRVEATGATALWVFLVTGEFGIPAVYKPSETIRTFRRLFAGYNLLNRVPVISPGSHANSAGRSSPSRSTRRLKKLRLGTCLRGAQSATRQWPGADRDDQASMRHHAPDAPARRAVSLVEGGAVSTKTGRVSENTGGTRKRARCCFTRKHSGKPISERNRTVVDQRQDVAKHGNDRVL